MRISDWSSDVCSSDLVGMVENMAGYTCPHCGEISDPFGRGGAEAAAAELGVPFLGRVPLDLAIRTASDAGTPPVTGTGDEAAAFIRIPAAIDGWLKENSGRRPPPTTKSRRGWRARARRTEETRGGRQG